MGRGTMRTVERDEPDRRASGASRAASAEAIRTEHDVMVALAKLFAPLPSYRRAGPHALRLHRAVRG